MFWSGTTAGDGGLVCSSRREGKTVHLYVKGGYIQRHSDMLAILSFVAIVLLVVLLLIVKNNVAALSHPAALVKCRVTCVDDV